MFLPIKILSPVKEGDTVRYRLMKGLKHKAHII